MEPKPKQWNLINLCRRGGYKDRFVNAMDQCGPVTGTCTLHGFIAYSSR